MTAFLQCFWMFTQIGFALFWNLVSSFGKVYDPSCTEFPWAFFHMFPNVLKWNLVSRFLVYSNHQKMCFGTRWRVCLFFMSNILPMCLPYWKCSTNYLWSSTKVDRTYLPVNMALALFQKRFWKNRNIFERGIGKFRICF